MSSQKSDKTASQPLSVAASPHIANRSLTTRSMMIDVIIGLLPVLAVSIWVFRQYALLQIGICLVSSLAAEALFTTMRKRKLRLCDCSAAVTGLILALSLPATAPWHVGLIGSFVAIGIGKIVFGGLGENLFNPAMVGRAFVMIAFPAALGASAYVNSTLDIQALTQATPLTALQQTGSSIPFLDLLIGNTNGSLGETSVVACLLGGGYLCLRRTASWEIPLGILGAVALIGGIMQIGGATPLSVWEQLASGALLFGAFFIASDPVTSPLTPRGKLIFGLGIGILVMIIRTLSGYPEGVMFSVLLMNAVTPLINRWTTPSPVGGAIARAEDG